MYKYHCQESSNFQQTRVIMKNCTVHLFKDRTGFVVVWLGFASNYFFHVVFRSSFGILMCQLSSEEGDIYCKEGMKKNWSIGKIQAELCSGWLSYWEVHFLFLRAYMLYFWELNWRKFSSLRTQVKCKLRQQGSPSGPFLMPWLKSLQRFCLKKEMLRLLQHFSKSFELFKWGSSGTHCKQYPLTFQFPHISCACQDGSECWLTLEWMSNTSCK